MTRKTVQRRIKNVQDFDIIVFKMNMLHILSSVKCILPEEQT